MLAADWLQISTIPSASITRTGLARFWKIVRKRFFSLVIRRLLC